MNRRELLKASCAFCGLGVVASSALLDSCTKVNDAPQGPSSINFTLDLSSSAYSGLKNTGSYAYKDGVIVANVGQNSFVALSQTCTHMGCTVGYDSNSGDFVCPCHGGTYAQSGKVLYGPPPAPLKSYNAVLSGNLLTVTG